MIQVFAYHEEQGFLHGSDIQQITPYLEDTRWKLWVDLDQPTEAELSYLNSVFKFHPAAIEDVIQKVGVPKIDLYDNHVFILFHRLYYHFETESCEHREFEVFISDHLIVTIHRDQLKQTFESVYEAVSQNPKQWLGRSPVFVFIKLIDSMLQAYFPIVQEWQDLLDDIEQQVLQTNQNKIFDQILSFKKLVAALRKSLNPEREILRQFYEKATPWLSIPASKIGIKKILDKMNLLLNEIESLREHTNSVFEIYVATLSLKMNESSHQLNHVMQRLTIAATIFLPLTFIVGVYGMNFDYFPELHWRWGYFALWAGMIGLTIGLLIFFRKKKWI